MSRLLDGMPYVPSCATNIRATFARVNDQDDWRSRVEGAQEVIRKMTPASATVTPIKSKARKPGATHGHE